MQYQCEVINLKAKSCLSIRTQTPVQNLPAILSKGYGDIYMHIKSLDLQPTAPPFAIYYNMDMQNLDIEFGFPVDQQAFGQNHILASHTPSGVAATCIYTGPYSDIEPAYNALYKWIKDNGYVTSGVAYEIYLNDPDKTPPQELKTQIALLLDQPSTTP